MLNTSDLLGILEHWSFWNEGPAPSVPRVLARSITALDPRIVTVIQGVRRSGKSTLLSQIMAQCELPKTKCVFINFEDPRLALSLNFTILDQIVATAAARLPGPFTFFFDEIQYVKGWEKWLNVQLERPKGNTFVITGSNSQLLSGELATSLTGRHLTYELFPFSFQEFRLHMPKASLLDYLRSGGFPGTMNLAKPEQLLQQYFEDIVEKDVRERLGAKSTLPLRSLAQCILEGTGSETSLRRVAGAVGISPETASHYIEACENAYLFLSCHYFAYSEAKRLRHNRKYYCIDTGLRRAVCSKTGAESGKDFEALVFLTLKQKNVEVFFWSDGGEVDFVVRSKNGVTPVQVTWEAPKPRHEKALTNFYAQFPHALEAVFVTPESFAKFVSLEF